MSAVLKVAVSQRVDVWRDRDERRDALDQRLTAFLQLVGVLPVPVPNSLSMKTFEGLQLCDSFNAWMIAVRPQAIILSGGNDIGECLERDQTERWLLDYARTKDLPLLGICRGMQMMAVHADADLVPMEGHVRTRHRLMAADGSGRWPDEVNSFHRFALTDCPVGFTVAACSENGAIEAMCHKSLPWEGWMWHPERENNFSSVDVNRLKVLFGV